MGLLYMLTGGIFGVGWMIDCLLLFLKPNPYYVRGKALLIYNRAFSIKFALRAS